MADREKVFDALRNCVTEPKCKDCPWEDCEKIGCKRTKVPVTLLLDTLKVLKEQQETITSLQGTICKLNAALAEQPEQKFFVDSDGKMTPLPVQKHGHWISLGDAHYTCSCCRTPRHMNFVPNYCSECGARMDEEVKQE